MARLAFSSCLFLCLLFFLSSSNAQEREIDAVSANNSVSSGTPYNFSLFRRLPAGYCAEGSPCADGSCCNGATGYCGLDAQHCDPSVCISNCDARAECGSWAEPVGKTCPLNVCCDQWGNCGTTLEFCSSGCQSNCDQPSSTGLSSSNVTSLVIGYVESWQITGSGAGTTSGDSCGARLLSWLPIDSLTHINVAFGYIDPGTLTIYPIPGADISIFQQITNLKQTAPGLKIWLSLGGWDFSDNDTTTQPVFGDIASSTDATNTFIDNLVSFMTEWAFDGVDIDWEYPGAPDRGGSTEDTENYVNLLRAIRARWDEQETPSGTTLGLSFTAPTSYWYLRWFDIANMTYYADWMNFMTYDLHGQWDSSADSIGSYIYAHTNLTEIQLGLDLLWRNDVPAAKVNLGIGFYGRTYTLADPTCTLPGCPFISGGLPGLCTQTEGYLSYAEIAGIMSTNLYKVTWDQVAGVKYLAWGGGQWVSFDDEETLKQKVEFANAQGLGGLFIWAVDQDDATHDLLNALLWPDGLGKFARQNGISSNGHYNEWSPLTSTCFFSDCAENPTCTAPGYLANGHSVRCDDGSRRQLCCPINNYPDPKLCGWNVGETFPGLFCQASCPTGELLVAQSSWYYIENTIGGSPDGYCFNGYADYCCPASVSGLLLCQKQEGICITINPKTHQPATAQDASNACPTGFKFLTYSQGTCDVGHDLYMPWCCEEEVDDSSCAWVNVLGGYGTGFNGCDGAQICPTGQLILGIDGYGNGSNCIVENTGVTTSELGQVERALCCDPNQLSITTNNLPVNLDNIFPSQPPSSNANEWQIKVDTSLNDNGLGDNSANDNAFGWYIISGPSDEVNTVDKRDGSDWEIWACDNEMHERQRTVKAVCSKPWDDSNCGEIFWGEVATTVVKMPAGCGPGKYAVAVSMEPAKHQILPRHLEDELIDKWGFKRKDAVVYDFTFDYDFGPIVRRGDTNKLIRIDYSDDPGYWANVVVAPPSKIKRDDDPELWVRAVEEHAMARREVQLEVDRDHGGSWERYLDHRWSKERRETPHHELHELHKRWFSGVLKDWLTMLRHVDTEYELIRHSVNQNYRWWLFDYAKTCQIGPFKTYNYLKSYADLKINIETSASLSLIGDFGDLSSWGESSVLFRNSGSVTTILNFEAFGQLTFNTEQVELFGLQNFGATFSIPGIVTIGPNFRIFGQITGEASLHAEALVSLQIAEWDYTQQYPNNDNTVTSGLSADSGPVDNAALGTPGGLEGNTPVWHADIAVAGSLTVHIVPVAQLGIVFNIQGVSIPDSYVSLGLDTFGTLIANATAGANNDGATAQACFGANVGYELYAQITAPTIFGYNFDQYWTIKQDTIPLIKEENTCISFTVWDGNNTCPDCVDFAED